MSACLSTLGFYLYLIQVCTSYSDKITNERIPFSLRPSDFTPSRMRRISLYFQILPLILRSLASNRMLDHGTFNPFRIYKPDFISLPFYCSTASIRKISIAVHLWSSMYLRLFNHSKKQKCLKKRFFARENQKYLKNRERNQVTRRVKNKKHLKTKR